MKLIKAIVFDLDHTLFDRYATIRQIVPFLKDHFYINEGITDEFIADELCYADKQYVHNGWKQIHAHLCDKNIFKVIPDYDSYTEVILSYFRKIAVKYDFTEPTLKALQDKGYKLGIITNGFARTQDCKLDLLGFRDYFEEILIGGETPFPKPDTRIFLLMAEKLGVKPEEMMYVGDHPKFDVDGSRNAGCVPVWVRTTGNWIFPEIEKCPLQVDTVAELPLLLENLSDN